MPSTALSIENVSKLYKLGVISTGTISHDLNRWWHRVRGLEDPYLRVAESNVRDQYSKSGYVWALKDVSFDVQHGEAIGIIGKNGAGKSTLLKILSRVTSLTKGEIKINGRIASLLEVGTGFHGELTGRENIFLNGTILGMKKHEIRSRLDEIIDFSGVERFIDTPVKRYSSGMYVRLAFAVAAHLEPEILIVDEVLAVGDAEFQKKAIGKMQDVSKGEGRTVLFVSHNMESILKLCQRGVLISNGEIEMEGPVEAVVNHYAGSNFGLQSDKTYRAKSNSQSVFPISVFVHDESFQKKDRFDLKERIGITCKYEIFGNSLAVIPGFKFNNSQNINLFDVHENITENKLEKEAGIYTSTVWIPGNFFNEGIVMVDLGFLQPNPFIVYFFETQVVAFNMTDDGCNVTRGLYKGQFPGILRPALKWETKKTKK